MFKLFLMIIIPAVMAEDDQTIVLDRGNDTSCTINLQGATVTSWKVNGVEQLFLSSKVVFDGKTDIMGGIPLVFPQFGRWDAGPLHGFVRFQPWKAGQKTLLTNNDIEVVLTLNDNDYTRSLWNHSFQLTYKVTLKENELHSHVNVNNLGNDTFNFNLLYHTFFQTPDVRNITIYGLKGTEYFDKTVENSTLQTETRDPLTIDRFIDNVYQNTMEKQTVNNLMSAELELQKTNLPDTVVWNPWEERSKSYLAEGEYLNMICIEAGHVSSYVELLPQQKFEAKQVLHVVKI